MLHGVYDRIRQSEFRPGSDHVTQVMKVQQTIVSKCPSLALPYRRLVCYCRLYEVIDPNKKDRPGENCEGARSGDGLSCNEGCVCRPTPAGGVSLQ